MKKEKKSQKLYLTDYKFIENVRFMTSSLSNIANNLAERNS